MDKETFRKKINKLIQKKGYKSGSAFIAEYQNIGNIPMFTLQSWIYRGIIPDSEDKRKDLCEFLQCDYEYLFGNQEEPHRDGMTASEYTGLSVDTVDAISEMPDDYKMILNALVKENCIELLFKIVGDWYDSSRGAEIILNERTLSHEESKAMLNYYIDTEIRSFVNFLTHNKEITNTFVKRGLIKHYLFEIEQEQDKLRNETDTRERIEIKKHIRFLESKIKEIQDTDYYEEFSKKKGAYT